MSRRCPPPRPPLGPPTAVSLGARVFLRGSRQCLVVVLVLLRLSPHSDPYGQSFLSPGKIPRRGPAGLWRDCRLFPKVATFPVSPGAQESFAAQHPRWRRFCLLSFHHSPWHVVRRVVSASIADSPPGSSLPSTRSLGSHSHTWASFSLDSSWDVSKELQCLLPPSVRWGAVSAPL